MTWSRCSTLTSLSSRRVPQPLPRLSADSVGPCTTVNTRHDVIDFHNILRHSLFVSKTILLTRHHQSHHAVAARGARQRRAALGLAEKGFRRRAAPKHVAHVDVGELQQHKQALKLQLTSTPSVNNLHCKYERGCIRRCTSSQQPRHSLLLDCEYNFTF